MTAELIRDKFVSKYFLLDQYCNTHLHKFHSQGHIQLHTHTHRIVLCSDTVCLLHTSLHQ